MGACQALGSGSNPGGCTLNDFMSKLNRKEGIKKINFLLDFAIKQSKTNNFYVYDYIKEAIRISKKFNYTLPNSFHYRFCKFCFSIRSTENTKFRIETRKKNKKFNKYLKIHCLNCDKIKKINIKKGI